MPRESLRHTHPNSPARRCLFGRSDGTLNARLESELKDDIDAQSRRWGFDFRNDRPLDAASSSSDMQYSELAVNEVPLAYRPSILKRKELPNGKVVEVKVYPAPSVYGRTRSQVASASVSDTSTSSILHLDSTDDAIHSDVNDNIEIHEEVTQVAALTPTRGTKRRHPEPSHSPMKLRRRPSPHKTPVSKTPVQMSTSASKKSRTSTRQLFVDKKQ